MFWQSNAEGTYTVREANEEDLQNLKQKMKLL